MIRSWFRPSLSRRLVIAMVLAFVLVEVGLTADNYRVFKKDEVGSSELKRFTHAFTKQLAEAQTPAEAVLLIRNTEALDQRHAQRPRPSDGRLSVAALRCPRESALCDARAVLCPVSARSGERIQIQGKTYWTIAVDAGPWRVRFAPRRSAM